MAGYERAWADFGRLDEAGHYNMMVTEDSRAVRPHERPSPWVDAWCGLLEHADRFMSPAWRDAGLYYPRNDALTDAHGNRVEVEPMTSNVLLGYARLNVPGGLWGLYNQPRDRGHFTEPALTAVERDVERLDGRGGRPGGGEDQKQFSRTGTRAATPHRARSRRRGNPALRRAAPALHPATRPVTAPVEPAFALVGNHGTPMTEKTYRGQWLLVFFGFTHCQVVCPRALGRLPAVLERLDEASEERLRAPYISVDPERDTPAVMKEFLRTYPRFTGLTGSVGAAEQAREAFRVFARRQADPADPDGYAVPHTAITYLITPDGQYAGHFADALPDADLAARLRAHLG